MKGFWEGAVMLGSLILLFVGMAGAAVWGLIVREERSLAEWGV